MYVGEETHHHTLLCCEPHDCEFVLTHSMRVYRVIVAVILDLDAGDQHHAPPVLPTGNETGTHRTADCVLLVVGLNVLVTRISLAPFGIRTPYNAAR